VSIRAATAVSEKTYDGRGAGVDVARRVKAELPLAARSVAIVFAAIDVDLPGLLAGIRSELDIPLIGCTTYGEATAEGYTEQSVTLLVLTSDDAELGIGLGEGLLARGNAAVTEAWAAASKSLTSPPKLVIAFPDAALSGVGEVVVKALLDVTEGAIPIIGGCPGDGGRFKSTHQLFGDRVVTDSVPLLLIGGNVSARVVTRTGWKPVGLRGTATRAEGPRLFEIDDKPAIKFMERYIAGSDVDDPEVLGNYPIAVFPEDNNATNDKFILRSAFFSDRATGSITYGAPIPQGAAVQLGRAFRDNVIDSASEAAREVLTDGPPACILFASCGGRKLVLGAKVTREVEALRETVGTQIPICGFYSYGELGPYDSRSADTRTTRYHNCTLVLCALG